jgi:hypothetical protein
MADKKFRDRQITIYMPSVADAARWKQLAGANSLSKWIYLQVEASLESAQAPSPPTPVDVNALRRENTLLRTEVALLEEKQAKELQTKLDRATFLPDIPISLKVISVIKSGGCWSAPNLAKELKIHNRQEAESIMETLEKAEMMKIIKKIGGGYTYDKR